MVFPKGLPIGLGIGLFVAPDRGASLRHALLPKRIANLPDGGEKPLRLKIVQAGDPVLREAAQPLTTQDILKDEVQRLIRDMRETMRDALGVGLAAPQVGLPLQLAVIEDQEDYLKNLPATELEQKGRRPVPFHVLINPQIVRAGDDRIEFYEGCLSLAGFSAIVPRTLTVRVEYLDERGEPRSVDASGWWRACAGETSAFKEPRRRASPPAPSDCARA